MSSRQHVPSDVEHAQQSQSHLLTSYAVHSLPTLIVQFLQCYFSVELLNFALSCRQVVLPNLAVLRIAVYSENGTSLLGHRILPVECLRPGNTALITKYSGLIPNPQTTCCRRLSLRLLRHPSLLSVQCISSIGQIIKSVASVCQSVSHLKRVERSTGHNLPPIFTKLATKVESQEM